MFVLWIKKFKKNLTAVNYLNIKLKIKHAGF